MGRWPLGSSRVAYGPSRPFTVFSTPPRVLLTVSTVLPTVLPALLTVLFSVSPVPDVPGRLTSGVLIVDVPEELPSETLEVLIIAVEVDEPPPELPI